MMNQLQKPKNKQCYIKHVGNIAYELAYNIQQHLFQKIIQIKLENKKKGLSYQEVTPNYLIFCEHPHTYTLGSSGTMSHILISRECLESSGISLYHTNRGGGITYHGPGQIVVYPVIDLENFFTDIHFYLRILEEAVIDTLHVLGLESGRIKGLTGVWVSHKNESEARKICSMGIKVSRWVTMHGLALNVITDLSYFQNIIPCGLYEKEVTSIAKELASPPSLLDVITLLQKKIISSFGMEPL